MHFTPKNNIQIEDTFKYIQDSFVSRKDMYLHKNLNNLLNDIKIPIKSYIYGAIPDDIIHIQAILLSFYNSTEDQNKTFNHKELVKIYIVFEVPVLQDSAVAILRTPDGREWSSQVKAFYGGMKIKDFDVYKYN
jgi:hypothetical protein